MFLRNVLDFLTFLFVRHSFVLPRLSCHTVFITEQLDNGHLICLLIKLNKINGGV